MLYTHLLDNVCLVRSATIGEESLTGTLWDDENTSNLE